MAPTIIGGDDDEDEPVSVGASPDTATPPTAVEPPDDPDNEDTNESGPSEVSADLERSDVWDAPGMVEMAIADALDRDATDQPSHIEAADETDEDGSGGDGQRWPALVLTDTWASRLVGGLPMLLSSEAEADLALPADLAPGAMVRVFGPTHNKLGWAIFDPDNGGFRLYVAHPPSENWGLGFLRRRVAAAYAWRKRLGLVRPLAAYRLVNGEGDHLSGFHVDVYARNVVIFAQSQALLAAQGALLAQAIEQEVRPESVIGKVRTGGEITTGRVDYVCYSGIEPPRTVDVEENGIRFEVHLTGGLNTGLFCDMRDVRRGLRELARGRRVLNTFCYTGSFSLACALGDARSVTSVDFAAGVLAWAKTNFLKNNLSADDHRYKFVRADVFEFLKQARRRDQQYDLIVLDPPPATAVPGRRWFLKSDYDRLIGHGLEVLAPKGIIVVAASSLSSRPDKLESQIRAAARDHKRQLRVIEQYGLPLDFPTQLIAPTGRYLKVYLLLAD